MQPNANSHMAPNNLKLTTKLTHPIRPKLVMLFSKKDIVNSDTDVILNTKD